MTGGPRRRLPSKWAASTPSPLTSAATWTRVPRGSLSQGQPAARRPRRGRKPVTPAGPSPWAESSVSGRNRRRLSAVRRRPCRRRRMRAGPVLAARAPRTPLPGNLLRAPQRGVPAPSPTRRPRQLSRQLFRYPSFLISLFFCGLRGFVLARGLISSSAVAVSPQKGLACLHLLLIFRISFWRRGTPSSQQRSLCTFHGYHRNGKRCPATGRGRGHRKATRPPRGEVPGEATPGRPVPLPLSESVRTHFTSCHYVFVICECLQNTRAVFLSLYNFYTLEVALTENTRTLNLDTTGFKILFLH